MLAANHASLARDRIFITVITSKRTCWSVPPETIPAFDPTRPRSRTIQSGPLIHLAAVQALLRSGQFNADQLWLATRKCENDLQKEQWSADDVLQMLASLDATQDYRKSEWCQVSGGRMVPCDAYSLPYDAPRGRRHPQGLAVYLKFSIDEDGVLAIMMVSCHAS